MRLLLGLVLVAAALWSGYWYLSASTVERGLMRWFEERRTDGWVAETSGIDVAGYPNRIDTTLSDVALADPETGLAWEAPFLQLFALSYRPTHIIAVWPNAQRLSTPFEKLELTSSDMRASLELQPSTDLEVNRLVLTAENLDIRREGEAEAAELTALTLAAERDGDTADYRLGLRAEGFKPALPFKAKIDPGGALPDRLEALSADLSVSFTRPWDQRAIDEARPQPLRVRVRLAEARWGQLELQLAGEVTVSDGGVPDGKMTLKARNWRDILELGRKSDWLPDAMADALEDALGLVAQLAGNPKTLDLPLDIAEGRVFLGPVPLGRAPLLRIR